MNATDLKNITPEQCVHIAKLYYPNVNWEYAENKDNSWEGHDLIVEGEENPIHFFQISFNGDMDYFDEGLYCYSVFGEAKKPIEDYIKTL